DHGIPCASGVRSLLAGKSRARECFVPLRALLESRKPKPLPPATITLRDVSVVDRCMRFNGSRKMYLLLKIPMGDDDRIVWIDETKLLSGSSTLKERGDAGCVILWRAYWNELNLEG